jgi:hypothetical protein
MKSFLHNLLIHSLPFIPLVICSRTSGFSDMDTRILLSLPPLSTPPPPGYLLCKVGLGTEHHPSTFTSSLLITTLYIHILNDTIYL